MKSLRIALLAALPLTAQQPVTWEERQAIALDNGKVELITLTKGGAFVSLLLKDDPEKMSPMWNPVRASREAGDPPRFGDSLGHFLCVDGFGPTSKDEQAAGFQGHGEAHRQPWEIVSQGKNGKVASVVFKARLPIVQETLTRKLELVDGEQVIYVESEIESLLGFDRPMNWAEHGTIGSPFLTPVHTVVDASVGRCQTRPYERPVSNHRLASAKEFVYPLAAGVDGNRVSIRSVPEKPDSMDHTGCLFDPDRALVFVTALRKDKKLLFGYLIRRADYPWLQEWMNYPKNMNLARGLEFGTQPFDVSRRQTVEMGNLFGMPAFKWLPAKGKVTTRFLMFYTRVPDGFARVDDVRQEGGKLLIEDRGNGKKVELTASLPLQ